MNDPAVSRRGFLEGFSFKSLGKPQGIKPTGGIKIYFHLFFLPILCYTIFGALSIYLIEFFIALNSLSKDFNLPTTNIQSATFRFSEKLLPPTKF